MHLLTLMLGVVTVFTDTNVLGLLLQPTPMKRVIIALIDTNAGGIITATYINAGSGATLETFNKFQVDHHWGRALPQCPTPTVNNEENDT